MVYINLLLGVTQWTVRGSKPGKDENFLIGLETVQLPVQWVRGMFPRSMASGAGG